MTRFSLLLIAALFFPLSVHAQFGFTQAQLDAAPECGKGTDLVEGRGMLCTCKARGFDRFVWGTGPYSGHSDICTAARHAGIITKAEGGAIVATHLPGQKEYKAGDANGIKGRRWGRYSSSFNMARAALKGGDAPVGVATGLPKCETFYANGAPYQCACPAGRGNTGNVWGSGPYTGDSDICSAARHAGAIGEKGGAIEITLEPGQLRYEGSKANGVTTGRWGAYNKSFGVKPIRARSNLAACSTMPDGTNNHGCVCAPNSAVAAVWGSGPYTADSDICTAARHAGAVGQSGGTVYIVRIRGFGKYRGSAANGYQTSDWGSFDSSIIFNNN